MIDGPFTKDDLLAEVLRLRQENHELKASRINNAVLENSSDGFNSLNEQWNFTYISPRGESHFLKPVHELLGKCIWEELPDYIGTQLYKDFHDVALNRVPICFETFSEYSNKWHEVSVSPGESSGKGAYLWGSASKLYNLQGNPSAAIQSLRDFSDRKQAEETLRHTEERFSKAFMASPIPMSISRQEDGVFLNVNDNYLQWAGYNREDMIGRSSVELNLWSDPGDRDELIRRLRKGEKIKDIEIKCHPNQGMGLVLLSMETIMLNGIECSVTMLCDITERRQMERDLARLERINLIGEMAASIGHEIRNPLTTIRGFLQMLSSKTCYEEDKMYFDLMIEELDWANEIISEYIGMAKDKRVNLQPQYLDEVLKSLYPMIQADANYREMDVRLELGKPPMPLFDANEIRQLILNMTRNGLEAMPPGGTLTIGSKLEGNEIILFIQDQGHGLDPELKDRLGTPFLTTKAKGKGLGLAICYSIAARHNARIDFETGPEGTTFYVHFPLPEEQILLL